MQPLKFLGIPISGVGYYMNWVLTNAQIELIAADVSVVDYDYGKRKKEKPKKGEFDNTAADAKEIKEAAEKWTQKHGTGENAGWVDVKNLLGNGMKQGVGLKLK